MLSSDSETLGIPWGSRRNPARARWAQGTGRRHLCYPAALPASSQGRATGRGAHR
jgi:hypothetical protein